MRVLVTGATGFLGSRLLAKLQERDGIEITALCRSDAKNLPDTVRVVTGDILDHDSLEGAASPYDIIFHLAALITFDPARKEELFRVNAGGTANILDAARRWQVGRTVVASSACTMGISKSPTEIRDEQTPLDAGLARRNPYMASKVEAERLAMESAANQDVVIVNPTTVYGPGDRTLNSGTLLLQVANSKRVPIPPGGSNVVDVDDVVNGMIAAAEKGRSGQRYVLGGDNLFFREIIEIICRALDRTPLKVPLPGLFRMPAAAAAWLVGKVSRSRFLTPQIVGDLFGYKYYSSMRAKQELGWQPQIEFVETVKRAWTFYRDNGLA